MASREPKRFVVSHQKGKRKRVYSRKEFAALASRFRGWARYRLSDYFSEIRRREKKLFGTLNHMRSATHLPSELDFYSRTANFAINMNYLAKTEFDLAKRVIDYFVIYRNPSPFSVQELGWAIRRLSETPREIEESNAQAREFLDFSATVRRIWNSSWSRLQRFVIDRPALFQAAGALFEKRSNAQHELVETQRSIDKKLGELKMDLESGMKTEKEFEREKKGLFRSLSIARQKMVLVEKEWAGCWIRVADEHNKHLLLTGAKKGFFHRSFIEELVRRKEKAVEESVRIIRMLPPNP